MRRLLVCASMLAACGDNGLPDGAPLIAGHDLVIVAHQDDDLLFMQPDQLDAVRSGIGVTTVYVTAGNGDKGADYANDRYRGLMSAYSSATGLDDWFCGWISVAEHLAEHCRLEGANLSLLFLGYPDGGYDTPPDPSHDTVTPNALLNLWEGQITGADTVAYRVAHYDQRGLISTIAAIIETTTPSTIRTLEVSATHGRDHEDHMIVGALALLGAALADSSAEILSYRGYNTESEPINTLDAVFAPSEDVFAHYDACATGCAACGQACDPIEDDHVTWLHRRYAEAIRRTASGKLQLDGQCASADSSGSLVMTDCATAPVWTFTPDHLLTVDTRCMSILFTGELVAGPCGPGETRTFFLDDEGHIYSGVAPLAEDNMDLAHLDCLIVSGGRPHGALCGDQHAPPATWEIANPVATTTRAAIGVQRTGRAVRLGDVTGDGLADLCEVRPAGLFCAPGNGDGTFEAMAHIAALPVDPASLTIGDVDNDGLPDACGRDANGVLCATQATHFVVQIRLSSDLGETDAATASSVTAIDGGVCGHGAAGVECTAYTVAPVVRSTWPPADAIVFPADLDGDGMADWCADSAMGPACATVAEQDVTTDGSLAAFAQAGVVMAPVLAIDSVAMADVDGDGRADLCSISTTDPTRVQCAFGQGGKLGPPATVAIVPAATSLWLGDIDGDGVADLCTSDATSVSCARGPAPQTGP
jgi:LmbE family N-acetylglucosaminyl deacetylase